MDPARRKIFILAIATYVVLIVVIIVGLLTGGPS
jgi:hypothetical protein